MLGHGGTFELFDGVSTKKDFDVRIVPNIESNKKVE